MQKIYLARLINGKEWRGICKHYVYEGKNILSFRFIRESEGILEVLAEQKEACEKIAGDYDCCLSIRQFGTEKGDLMLNLNGKRKLRLMNLMIMYPHMYI